MSSDGSDVSKILEDQEGLPLYLAFSPVPSLEMGKEYLITAAGANLNVRQAGSLSATVIRKLNEKEKIRILNGPIKNDGYYWWQIELSDEEIGWIADVHGWFAIVK